MTWDARSTAALNGVDPRLAEILALARERSGVNFQIGEGLRTPDRQAEMVRTGKSQTYNSRHLTGNATDIYIVGPDGKPNYDFEAYRPIAEAAKSAAAELGYNDFVWGGDWTTLKDGVHFQIGGAPAKGGKAQTVAPNALPSAPGAALPPAPPVPNALAQFKPQSQQIDPAAFMNNRNALALMPIMAERRNTLARYV